MPLMKLLQNIDSDDKTTTKHKKLPQSDNESDEDIVSFLIKNFHDLSLTAITIQNYQNFLLIVFVTNSNVRLTSLVIDVDLPRQWIDDARHASRVIRLM